MNKGSLYRVEFYRFFHSFSIIKYSVFVSLLLLFMSYTDMKYTGNEITEELAWASLTPVFPYLLALVCVMIAVYVGREFRQKTINYEIMRGYGFCKIAFSKTLTCAIILPVLILICMMVYLGIFCGLTFCELYFRGCGIFFLLFHLCSVSVLYVLLCRMSVIGGSLAFFRFFVLEAVLPTGTQPQLMKLNVFNQWYQLVDAKTPLTMEWLVNILGIAAVEYGILQMVLSGSAKWRDM